MASQEQTVTPKNNTGQYLESLTEKYSQLDNFLHQQHEATERAISQLMDELNNALRDAGDQNRRSDELMEEVDRLRQALEEGSQGEVDTDGFRQKYEMAMDDLKELRNENQRLRADLEEASKRPAASGGPVSGIGASFNGPLDWEAQKQMLLASLESDYAENEPEQQQQKLQMEDVIRRTNQAIDQKNREIEQLRERIDSQEHEPGAARPEIQQADFDEMLAEEKSKIQQLQQEWREKISQAEIELSVERAKLARERAEIEEIKFQLEQSGVKGEAGEKTAAAKPSGGRWFEKLGLRSGDSDQ